MITKNFNADRDLAHAAKVALDNLPALGGYRLHTFLALCTLQDAHGQIRMRGPADWAKLGEIIGVTGRYAQSVVWSLAKVKDAANGLPLLTHEGHGRNGTVLTVLPCVIFTTSDRARASARAAFQAATKRESAQE